MKHTQVSVLVLLCVAVLLPSITLQELAFDEDENMFSMGDIASFKAAALRDGPIIPGESTQEEQAKSFYGSAVRSALQALTTNSSYHFTLAMNMLDKALMLQPRFTEAYIVRGLIYIGRGELIQAKDEFEAILSSFGTASWKDEVSALQGYTEELLSNKMNSAKLLKPLFWQGNPYISTTVKASNLPTTSLLVDNYNFVPSWLRVDGYSGYNKPFGKLLVFQELYKRLQSTNWDLPSEFSWPTFPTYTDVPQPSEQTNEDKAHTAAAAESLSFMVTLRGGPNIHLNKGNMTAARKILREKEAVHLRGVLQPAETQLLWDYYNEMVSSGGVPLDTYLQRYTAHNDRIGYWLLHRFKDFAEALMGEPLKPSYTFLSYYQNPKTVGVEPANLRPHTDKADNELTMSFQLKIHISEEDKLQRGVTWPLWVHKGTVPPVSSWHEKPPLSDSVSFNLLEGDALAFRGRTHIHWRDPLSSSIVNCTTFLLHYIPLDFDYEGFVKGGR